MQQQADKCHSSYSASFCGLYEQEKFCGALAYVVQKLTAAFMVARVCESDLL
jgi:hypothetical protein